ncbi:hypothetical protein V8F20_003446, partial [Naviculisporaceae sp. PSN 640]
PAAAQSQGEPNSRNPDYSMTSPLVPGSLQGGFPCKGYHTLLNTPEGASVATWTAGSTNSITLEGGAIHGGGSCQISLSIDSGNSFKVLKSWIGGCPSSRSAELSFSIPSDTPDTKQALLAWSWFNLIGNREMYMNCVVVDITGGGGGNGGVGFFDRPEIFTANIGEDCKTVDGGVLEFPNPGPDVERSGDDRTVDAVGGACQKKGDVGARPQSGENGDEFGTSEGEGGDGGERDDDGGHRGYSGQGGDDGQQTESDYTPGIGGFIPGSDFPGWYHPNGAPTSGPYTGSFGN